MSPQKNKSAPASPAAPAGRRVFTELVIGQQTSTERQKQRNQAIRSCVLDASVHRSQVAVPLRNYQSPGISAARPLLKSRYSSPISSVKRLSSSRLRQIK